MALADAVSERSSDCSAQVAMRLVREPFLSGFRKQICLRRGRRAGRDVPLPYGISGAGIVVSVAAFR